jgi:hypothetical protein
MLIVPITDVWNDNSPLLKAKWLKYRAARKSPGDIPLASYVSHSSHTSESRPSRSGYLSLDTK